MKAKKSLGQHFLTSEAAVHHMVTASGAQNGDTVLEIGPGKGVLTKALLATGAQVIAVEKDYTLIPLLEEKFKTETENTQLILIHEDILKFDITTLKISQPKGLTLQSNSKGRTLLTFKVVANIPYYITGEIMRLFLESNTQPESMTLLVQKEVAERIVGIKRKKAKPQTKKDSEVARFAQGEFRESILSLSVKLFGTPSLVSVVKRGSFFPIPNVDSAIIHIADISHKHISGFTISQFFTAIKAGFAHKRKKLISNLESVYEKSALAHAFSELSLDTNLRSEDLSLSTWVTLVQKLLTIG